MVDPTKYVEAMWQRQDLFGPALNMLWQDYMGPAIDRVGDSRSGFTDEARNVQNRARRFGETDEFVELSTRFITDIYILAALYMRARDEQVRERGADAPAPTPIRVDKATLKEATAIADYDLSLADQQAIQSLIDVHVMWFTDADGAVYNNVDFTAEALELIRDGKTGIQVAEALKTSIESAYGVGADAGKGLLYWEGVAEHAASTAGVSGQLTTLAELGWTRYTVVNPMDERTSRVCQHMNGKSVLVEDGIRNLRRTLGAETPDDVRAVKPFVSGGSPAEIEAAIGAPLTVGSQDLTSAQSAALADAGFAMPPYHFRCRSFIDIAFDA